MNTNGIGQNNNLTKIYNKSRSEVTKGKSKDEEVLNDKLSEKAQKYYEKLKKKYANMEFILISEDKKEEAQRNVDNYKSNKGMIVLINTDKIEKMADDEAYRKKYEGIISGATAQMNQMKTSLGDAANSVKTYGMKFDKSGNASFFAVIDKLNISQKKRIEKSISQKANDKKRAEKEETKKRIEAKKTEKNNDTNINEDTITVTASSWEELLDKIKEIVFEENSNNTKTDIEKKLGQNLDYTI